MLMLFKYGFTALLSLAWTVTALWPKPTQDNRGSHVVWFSAQAQLVFEDRSLTIPGMVWARDKVQGIL